MRVITLLMLVLGAMLWLEPETIRLRGEDALPIRHEPAVPTLGVSGGVCMTSMPISGGSSSTAVMVPCTSNTSTVWTVTGGGTK